MVKSGDDWSESEMIVTCDIFLRKGTNTESIKEGMKLTGRSESSISRRYGNYQYYQTNGEHGLSNGGPLPLRIWNKYSKNPELLAEEAKRRINRGMVDDLSNSSLETRKMEILLDRNPGEYREAYTKQRVNQDKLRSKVLVAANYRCCLTGICDEELLIASHIKDWSECKPSERTDVHNALCLNRFHDGLFDRYLMTISEDGKVFYSSKLKEYIPEEIYDLMISRYDKIEFNENNKPSLEYVKYHNQKFIEKTGESLPF